EALVRRESSVEALEEDLEAARAAAARSTGSERDLLQAAEALKARLAEAQAQEEQTRARLQALERELRAGDRSPAALGDAEQERLRRQAAELGIVTREPAMLALFRDLGRAARASLPILLAGEPGTGKELFARAGHRLSVGAAKPTTVDVRVVAGSNRDLARGVSEGWFREDLYFRLKGLVLALPPLRERRRDVEPLAARFLEEAAAETHRSVSLSEAALQV